MKPATSPCADRMRAHLKNCVKCQIANNLLSHCERGQELMRAELEEDGRQAGRTA